MGAVFQRGIDPFVVDGKSRRVHEAGQRVEHVSLDIRLIPDADACLWKIIGLENGKPDDVIPVGVGEHQVKIQPALIHQVPPQAPDAAAGIHHDRLPVFCQDLQARGVSTVLQELGS